MFTDDAYPLHTISHPPSLLFRVVHGVVGLPLVDCFPPTAYSLGNTFSLVFQSNAKLAFAILLQIAPLTIFLTNPPVLAL